MRRPMRPQRGYITKGTPGLNEIAARFSTKQPVSRARMPVFSTITLQIERPITVIYSRNPQGRESCRLLSTKDLGDLLFRGNADSVTDWSGLWRGVTGCSHLLGTSLPAFMPPRVLPIGSQESQPGTMQIIASLCLIDAPSMRPSRLFVLRFPPRGETAWQNKAHAGRAAPLAGAHR
jgi:hypothetical protein